MTINRESTPKNVGDQPSNGSWIKVLGENGFSKRSSSPRICLPLDPPAKHLSALIWPQFSYDTSMIWEAYILDPSASSLLGSSLKIKSLRRTTWTFEVGLVTSHACCATTLWDGSTYSRRMPFLSCYLELSPWALQLRHHRHLQPNRLSQPRLLVASWLFRGVSQHNVPSALAPPLCLMAFKL